MKSQGKRPQHGQESAPSTHGHPSAQRRAAFSWRFRLGKGPQDTDGCWFQQIYLLKCSLKNIWNPSCCCTVASFIPKHYSKLFATSSLTCVKRNLAFRHSEQLPFSHASRVLEDWYHTGKRFQSAAMWQLQDGSPVLLVQASFQHGISLPKADHSRWDISKDIFWNQSMEYINYPHLRDGLVCQIMNWPKGKGIGNDVSEPGFYRHSL